MTPRFSENAADKKLTGVLWMLLVFLIGCITILALVPPVSRDALVHHLNVPKLYLQYGKIVQFPSMSFSYFPMNLDFLYIIPLWFGNDIIPKFIHFAFALLTAWIIYGYLKPRGGKNYALIGVLFFLSMPIIVKLSITVYVDLGLIFFSTAALLLLFRWVETGFRLTFLTGSAVCCGLAMGTKYNGLIVCFILTAFVPCLYSAWKKDAEKPFVKAIGSGVLYVSIALVVFSPWMIRNWHWKGNPVYPLYNSVFHPPKSVAATSKEGKNSKAPKGIFTYRSIVYQETEWQMLLLPVRIFFEGEDGNGQYFDGKLNPFLLIFTILAFVGMGSACARPNHSDSDISERYISEPARWLAAQKKFLLIFSVLYFLIALFSTVLRIRYISPIVPPLVILSVFGMKNAMAFLRAKLGTGRRFAATLIAGMVLAACFALNIDYLRTQFAVVDPVPYLIGDVSRDEYITRYRPEYPVMQYANQHLPADARILFVFMGKRGYYCDREYVMDSAESPSLLMKIVARSQTPEAVAAKLGERGITHIMLQFDICDRWIHEDVPEERRELLTAFLRRHTTLIQSHQLYGLLAVEPSDQVY